MKRVAALFVALLAALVLLHVGLPHCAGGRSPEAATAAGMRINERPAPAPPMVIHRGDVDRSGLPDRARSGGGTHPHCLTAMAVADRATATEPHPHARHNRPPEPAAPDLAALQVYRC